MRCSICYTSYNKPKIVEQTLPSLAETTSNSTTIYVVDNGSDTETVQLLKRVKVRYPRLKLVLNEENLGVGAAMNQVLSSIPPDQCFMKFDSDVLLETEGWDRWMMTCLEKHPEIGLLGIKNFGDRNPYHIFRAWDGNPLGLVEFNVMTGDSMMMAPPTRQQIGYFFEFGKYGYEDSELFYRIKALDKHLAFVMHFKSAGIDEPAVGEYKEFKESQARDNIKDYWPRISYIKNTRKTYVDNVNGRKITSFWEPEAS